LELEARLDDVERLHYAELNRCCDAGGSEHVPRGSDWSSSAIAHGYDPRLTVAALANSARQGTCLDKEKIK
jgi:hypothetical protein